jgi:uncharacterized protein with ATP-grasp and redox domains
MHTSLDCLPCFIRQAIDVARLVSKNPQEHEQILRHVLATTSEMDLSITPVEIGQYIHQYVRTITGISDPYTDIKKKFNDLALSLYPELKQTIEQSDHPIETAVRLAIAGNIIDYGTQSKVDDSLLHEAIDHALKEPLLGDISLFVEHINQANVILYLLDNAGEIVFDRLLIEQLPSEKITAVVKSGPIINDSTIHDAAYIKLTDIIPVIENGDTAPGTLLHRCSKHFIEQFERADLVIAKGQGNYESLNDVTKNIFFILKAKCSVIAEYLDCQQGNLILKHN